MKKYRLIKLNKEDLSKFEILFDGLSYEEAEKIGNDLYQKAIDSGNEREIIENSYVEIDSYESGKVIIKREEKEISRSKDLDINEAREVLASLSIAFELMAIPYKAEIVE